MEILLDYIDKFLRDHAGISHDFTILARQLASNENGLPIEVYCYTKTTDRSCYESIQASIIEHILAVLSAFNLQIYQRPYGGKG